MIGHTKPTKKQKEEARQAVWERCKGFCEKCGRAVIFERGLWPSMHTAHIKGGVHRPDWSAENLQGLCMWCHGDDHSGGKVVPKK